MARPRIEPEAALTQTTFRLSESDLQKVREIAALEDRSPSQWIRRAVKEKIEEKQNG
jgi:predicted transcriptional regulator